MSKAVKKTKTLTELEACDCRWPIGDPRQEGFHFCGARQLLGRPYCQEHWDMSFDAAKPRNKPVTALPMLRRAA
jgi:GcrA cell cycle regulator